MVTFSYMDSLTIHGLTLRVRVGCTARERARPQRLSADIRLETSLRRAGERDDLRFTVDYAALAGRLRT
ncbi:MAG TPA: dihydroneopterin aldolase, partial [Elusimicrobiota bacterium]|nr:dihydroneopterin aldolase [Elusimicrobiota bacterium]